MRGARRGLLAGIGVLAAVLTVLPAAAARAADPLALSTDGVTWAATLPGALFGSPSVVVPGDVISSALWVRNESGDRARVGLEVSDDLGAVPGTLAGDLSLTIDGVAVAGGTSWQGPELAPGATLRIPLVVTFAASSHVASSVSAATVLDSVTLVQAVGAPVVAPPAAAPTSAAARATPHGRPTSGGGLAHTGADVAGAVGASFAAVGVGILLLAARRRSRRAED
ncbi:hypothetical protein [Cellulomonas sp. ICMP 17802]|uniref:hypothetical protein n=1 Tax=Cellulomonas sp. ICMP 17802 TaxID=3239199 RepID=UPI00351AC3A9